MIKIYLSCFFFNLKKNDVVVVPMNRSIMIGVVIGEKSYKDNLKNGYNRVSVNFMRDEPSEGTRQVSTRTGLITNQLLSRLRVRTAKYIIG